VIVHGLDLRPKALKMFVLINADEAEQYESQVRNIPWAEAGPVWTEEISYSLLYRSLRWLWLASPARCEH